MGDVSPGISNGGCERVWGSIVNIPLGEVSLIEVGQKEGRPDLRARCCNSILIDCTWVESIAIVW